MPKSADLAGSTTNALVTAGATGITLGLSTKVQLLSAALPLLATFLDKTVGFLVERWQARAERWLDKLLKEYGSGTIPDAELGARIVEAAEKPAFKKAIYESMRSLQDALADEVVPAIAKLMAEYTKQGIDPDGRFRGLSRVLCDLSDVEFVSLRQLIEAADNASVDYPTDDFVNIGISKQDGKFELREINFEPHQSLPLGTISEARRLFALLKTNGLAEESLERWGDEPGNQVMAIRKEELAFIRGILAN